MARVRVYTNSILATILSFCGYGLLVCGMITVFSGGMGIAVGIILALIGLGIAFWAATISDNKQFRAWIRQLEADGINHRMREDARVAFAVYNSNPCKKTLNYISKWNPNAAAIIADSIRSKKKN